MKTISLTAAAAALALATACATPAMAQPTTVPSTGTSSPAARDAQGHAADSTAPMAHSKGTKDKTDSGMSSSASSGTGMKATMPRTGTTPMNTTPGAGLRNSGDAVPSTSGASGR